MYIKGVRKERKVVNQAKARGLIAFRSAGSHSPIDVVIINVQTGHISLVQCKNDSMPVAEKKRLEEKYSSLNGMFKVRFDVV